MKKNVERSTMNLKSRKAVFLAAFMIISGAFIQALAYSVFIAPFKIVPGGVYGIAIILHHITRGLFSFIPDGLPIGLTALCFNIPLLILAIKKLGLGSGTKTIATFVLISFFTDTITYITGGLPLVNDTLLSCFYGGALLGFGVSLIFRANSTSAGTDVLARVIAKTSNVKIGNLIITIDSIVVVLGLLALHDWAIPLYSWFAIFIMAKVVDLFLPENPGKAFFIVSTQTEKLRNMFVEKLKLRGTFIHGEGMYNGEERKIAFTILERKDIQRVKKEIRTIDPNAFISSMDANKDVTIV